MLLGLWKLPHVNRKPSMAWAFHMSKCLNASYTVEMFSKYNLNKQTIAWSTLVLERFEIWIEHAHEKEILWWNIHTTFPTILAECEVTLHAHGIQIYYNKHLK